VVTDNPQALESASVNIVVLSMVFILGGIFPFGDSKTNFSFQELRSSTGSVPVACSQLIWVIKDDPYQLAVMIPDQNY
jgi:hypothetical protein